MNWPAILGAHVLLLLLIGYTPTHVILLRFRLVRHEARHGGSISRVYLRYMRDMWLAVLLLVLLGLGLGWSPQTPGLHAPANIFLAVCLVIILAVVLSASSLSLRRALCNPKKRDFLIKRLDQALPSTKQERFLYVPASLTAGICEEHLFRGFIPTYLTHFFPVSLFYWPSLFQLPFSVLAMLASKWEGW